jgi:hypothetical protein
VCARRAEDEPCFFAEAALWHITLACYSAGREGRRGTVGDVRSRAKEQDHAVVSPVSPDSVINGGILSSHTPAHAETALWCRRRRHFVRP